MRRSWGRLLLLSIMLLATLTPRVSAGEPNYDVLRRLALPWASGKGHRVTWDPAGHWSNSKATGAAFDFSMAGGTPLFAPADGMAYFLRDDRPFDTNLGNYIELLVDRNWLVRLAHLQDEQSGQRMVRAGELIGHSGGTGAASEHLHVEILMWQGTRWGRPDLERVEQLFGMPPSDFVEGAIITNNSGAPQLEVRRRVLATQSTVRLGEPLDLVVSLYNNGLRAFNLHTLQLSLATETGHRMVAEARGNWRLAGKGNHAVVVHVWPSVAGAWQIEQVVCEGGETTFRLPAEGSFRVEPSGLKLVGLTTKPILDVGGRIEIEAWVENSGQRVQTFDGLVVRGTRPDGAPWVALATRNRAAPAGGMGRYVLHSPTVPQAVGEWRIERIGYQKDGHEFFFAGAKQSFRVEGPELAIREARIYPTSKSLSVLLTVVNTGTRAAIPDSIDAWGWRPGGDQSFTLTSSRPVSIAVGGSALIQLSAPWDGTEGLWRLIEVGCWADGNYCRIALPEQPAIMVDQALLDKAQPQ